MTEWEARKKVAIRILIEVLLGSLGGVDPVIRL